MEPTIGASARVAILVACGLPAAASLLASQRASAATKIADGFATRMTKNGAPANRVSRAKAGDDVNYWIEWKDVPAGRVTIRCVIKLGSKTISDETDAVDEAESEGFSNCDLDTDTSDFEPGAYTFAQYLDGEKVGEGSIAIEKTSFFTTMFGKPSVYRQYKWALGALACVFLAVYWVRKKLAGDHEAAAAVFRPDSAPPVTRETAVIGSRIDDGGHSQEVAAAVAKTAGDAEDLRKCGLQYQALIAQADKSKGIEAGRRYVSLLLKARNVAEALKIFKECIAADPAFRLALPEEVLPVAKAARAAGDPQAAIAALRGFDKAYPGNALIPDVFVFTAKLMAEDLRNPGMAKKILEHVLQRYPGHQLAPEAKRYLQSMPQVP
jgi:tetratricopeptide (TPR) repeat protein